MKKAFQDLAPAALRAAVENSETADQREKIEIPGHWKYSFWCQNALETDNIGLWSTFVASTKIKFRIRKWN